ncbi:hypothetical protein H696_02973 [Fonticula alba]|uniref:Exostosin GT47 domain-containing protein n=1 Tax=Fonticula alba TaxID=691883 RepID=A0A058Z944_FONAL|nr:hypothetical protein H696_02973 [Fonticula alba]KCV70616.1 hypothetical protein H696_02973 [Fonticula alba]|eukprot:XP_009495132.1 hypothetical protein H696_02973 [Fonticula alba]
MLRSGEPFIPRLSALDLSTSGVSRDCSVPASRECSMPGSPNVSAPGTPLYYSSGNGSKLRGGEGPSRRSRRSSPLGRLARRVGVTLPELGRYRSRRLRTGVLILLPLALVMASLVLTTVFVFSGEGTSDQRAGTWAGRLMLAAERLPSGMAGARHSADQPVDPLSRGIRSAPSRAEKLALLGQHLNGGPLLFMARSMSPAELALAEQILDAMIVPVQAPGKESRLPEDWTRGSFTPASCHSRDASAALHVLRSKFPDVPDYLTGGVRATTGSAGRPAHQAISAGPGQTHDQPSDAQHGALHEEDFQSLDDLPGGYLRGGIGNLAAGNVMSDLLGAVRAQRDEPEPSFEHARMHERPDAAAAAAAAATANAGAPTSVIGSLMSRLLAGGTGADASALRPAAADQAAEGAQRAIELATALARMCGPAYLSTPLQSRGGPAAGSNTPGPGFRIHVLNVPAHLGSDLLRRAVLTMHLARNHTGLVDLLKARPDPRPEDFAKLGIPGAQFFGQDHLHDSEWVTLPMLAWDEDQAQVQAGLALERGLRQHPLHTDDWRQASVFFVPHYSGALTWIHPSLLPDYVRVDNATDFDNTDRVYARALSDFLSQQPSVARTGGRDHFVYRFAMYRARLSPSALSSFVNPVSLEIETVEEMAAHNNRWTAAVRRVIVPFVEPSPRLQARIDTILAGKYDWEADAERRRTGPLVYFAGTYTGRSGPIRKKLFHAMRDFGPRALFDQFDNAGGGRHNRGKYEWLHERMESATFCPHLPGDSSSARRLTTAMLAGCIPVVLSDFAALPYESLIDWDQLVIRIPSRAVFDYQRHMNLTDKELFPETPAPTVAANATAAMAKSAGPGQEEETRQRQARDAADGDVHAELDRLLDSGLGAGAAATGADADKAAQATAQAAAHAYIPDPSLPKSWIHWLESIPQSKIREYQRNIARVAPRMIFPQMPFMTTAAAGNATSEDAHAAAARMTPVRRGDAVDSFVEVLALRHMAMSDYDSWYRWTTPAQPALANIGNGVWWDERTGEWEGEAVLARWNADRKPASIAAADASPKK